VRPYSTINSKRLKFPIGKLQFEPNSNENRLEIGILKPCEIFVPFILSWAAPPVLCWSQLQELEQSAPGLVERNTLCSLLAPKKMAG
jgi:hypothetical protein